MPSVAHIFLRPALAIGASLIALASSPAIGQGFDCPANDFSSVNHSFRTQLDTKTGAPAVEHLKRWTLWVHCASRTDRGVTLTVFQRKAIFFEIGDAFVKRHQSCMALQAVGMARLRFAPGLGGFWSIAETQSVNQYLLACLRSAKLPLGRSRSSVFREAVSGMAKPSGLQEDLRTADNIRIGAGARLAQALLDTLDVLLSLDFGKDRGDRRISATLTALHDREALADWNVLWAGRPWPVRVSDR